MTDAIIELLEHRAMQTVRRLSWAEGRRQLQAFTGLADGKVREGQEGDCSGFDFG